jgi:hypothetical protein
MSEFSGSKRYYRNSMYIGTTAMFSLSDCDPYVQVSLFQKYYIGT